MSDIFSEVDEEVRRERLQKLWERWGNSIIAAGGVDRVGDRRLARLAMVGGSSAAAEAGAAFDAAITLAEAGKHQEAETALTRSPPIRPPATARSRGSARPRNSPSAIAQGAIKAYDALAADRAAGTDPAGPRRRAGRASAGRYGALSEMQRGSSP